MIKKVTLLASLLGFYAANAQLHVGSTQTYTNIQNAMAVAQPGDTIYMHAGSYQGYQWISDVHGKKNQWITVTRYKNDAMDIAGGWQFSNCSYMKFTYLNFKGNTTYTSRLFHFDNAGDCATQSHHINVDSCYFSNVTDPTYSAFKFGAADTFEVTHCLFKDIASGAFDFNACRSGIIKNNRIENCATGGHIKGGAMDILMEQNLFLNASAPGWVDFELGGDTGAQFYCPNDTFEVKNLTFYSNLVIGGNRGIALSSARECKVINNTFYNCKQMTMRFLTVSGLYPAMRANRVENNIFAFGATGAYMNGGAQPASAVSMSNNIYYSIVNASFSGPYWDSPELDAIKESSLALYGNGTTMFVNPGANDFHLMSGSPAIAAGKNETEPLEDYYGFLYKSTRSIGAAEYNSVSSVKATLSDAKNFVCFPNPSSTGYITIAGYDAKQNADVKKIEIWTVEGKNVLSQSIQQLPAEINVGQLSKGIYILKMIGGNLNSTLKLVIE